MRKANMNKQEIIDYLTNDMKTLIEDDIKPCLLIHQPRGGYFSVPKLVLSCVDYLAALYCGWQTHEAIGGRPNFTSTAKALRYLQEVFGQVFSEYRVRAELLWQVYRHGTVHLNEPKFLQNGAKTIWWQVFKGNFKQRMMLGAVPTGVGSSVQMVLSHLVPMEIPTLRNQWVFPICSTCLYEDLLDSLDIYAQKIDNDSTSTLEAKFRSAVDEMVKPEQTTITWP